MLSHEKNQIAIEFNCYLIAKSPINQKPLEFLTRSFDFQLVPIREGIHLTVFDLTKEDFVEAEWSVGL